MLSNLTDRAWAEISLNDIEYNYKAISQYKQSDCNVIAVLKADAYGHGATRIARSLENSGCNIFAVATINEAIELRENNIKSQILVFFPIQPRLIRLAYEYNLIIPVTSLQHANSLQTQAISEGISLSVFVKIDCGLSRLGIVVAGNEANAANEVYKISQLSRLSIHSIMTHLTGGGLADKDELNIQQLSIFKKFTERLITYGLRLPRHCCASRSSVRFPDYNYEYIRVGSALFGAHEYYGIGPHFREAMQLKTRIVQIKEVNSGVAVGYGPAFKTVRKTKIAVLPIGYADGLSCRLGNQMHMLVHGIRAPQIGRLCMDYCMLDITDIKDIQENDIVTVFGWDNNEFLSIQEHAKLYSGTANELFCLLGKRIPRLYFYDNKLC